MIKTFSNKLHGIGKKYWDLPSKKRNWINLTFSILMIASLTFLFVFHSYRRIDAVPIRLIPDDGGLELLSQFPNGHFELTTDIVAPLNFAPINNFTGTLDGAGNVIRFSGHTIIDVGADNVYFGALFREIGTGGSVRDLHLEFYNVVIQINDTLSASFQDESINYLQYHYTRFLPDVFVGGIAGHMYGNASISQSSVTGNLRVVRSIGEFENFEQTISNQRTSASTQYLTIGANYYIGGLVGRMSGNSHINSSLVDGLTLLGSSYNDSDRVYPRTVLVGPSGVSTDVTNVIRHRYQIFIGSVVGYMTGNGRVTNSLIEDSVIIVGADNNHHIVGYVAGIFGRSTSNNIIINANVVRDTILDSSAGSGASTFTGLFGGWASTMQGATRPANDQLQNHFYLRSGTAPHNGHYWGAVARTPLPSQMLRSSVELSAGSLNAATSYDSHWIAESLLRRPATQVNIFPAAPVVAFNDNIIWRTTPPADSVELIWRTNEPPVINGSGVNFVSNTLEVSFTALGVEPSPPNYPLPFGFELEVSTPRQLPAPRIEGPPTTDTIPDPPNPLVTNVTYFWIPRIEIPDVTVTKYVAILPFNSVAGNENWLPFDFDLEAFFTDYAISLDFDIVDGRYFFRRQGQPEAGELPGTLFLQAKSSNPEEVRDSEIRHYRIGFMPDDQTLIGPSSYNNIPVFDMPFDYDFDINDIFDWEMQVTTPAALFVPFIDGVPDPTHPLPHVEMYRDRAGLAGSDIATVGLRRIFPTAVFTEFPLDSGQWTATFNLSNVSYTVMEDISSFHLRLWVANERPSQYAPHYKQGVATLPPTIYIPDENNNILESIVISRHINSPIAPNTSTRVYVNWGGSNTRNDSDVVIPTATNNAFNFTSDSETFYWNASNLTNNLPGGYETIRDVFGGYRYMWVSARALDSNYSLMSSAYTVWFHYSKKVVDNVPELVLNRTGNDLENGDIVWNGDIINITLPNAISGNISATIDGIPFTTFNNVNTASLIVNIGALVNTRRFTLRVYYSRENFPNSHVAERTLYLRSEYNSPQPMPATHNTQNIDLRPYLRPTQNPSDVYDVVSFILHPDDYVIQSGLQFTIHSVLFVPYDELSPNTGNIRNLYANVARTFEEVSRSSGRYRPVLFMSGTGLAGTNPNSLLQFPQLIIQYGANFAETHTYEFAVPEIWEFDATSQTAIQRIHDYTPSNNFRIPNAPGTRFDFRLETIVSADNPYHVGTNRSMIHTYWIYGQLLPPTLLGLVGDGNVNEIVPYRDSIHFDMGIYPLAPVNIREFVTIFYTLNETPPIPHFIPCTDTGRLIPCEHPSGFTRVYNHMNGITAEPVNSTLLITAIAVFEGQHVMPSPVSQTFRVRVGERIQLIAPSVTPPTIRVPQLATLPPSAINIGETVRIIPSPYNGDLPVLIEFQVNNGNWIEWTANDINNENSANTALNVTGNPGQEFRVGVRARHRDGDDGFLEPSEEVVFVYQIQSTNLAPQPTLLSPANDRVVVRTGTHILLQQNSGNDDLFIIYRLGGYPPNPNAIVWNQATGNWVVSAAICEHTRIYRNEGILLEGDPNQAILINARTFAPPNHPLFETSLSSSFLFTIENLEVVLPPIAIPHTTPDDIPYVRLGTIIRLQPQTEGSIAQFFDESIQDWRSAANGIPVVGDIDGLFTVRARAIMPDGATIRRHPSPEVIFTYVITDRYMLDAARVTPATGALVAPGSQIRIDNPNNLPTGQATRIGYEINGVAGFSPNSTHFVDVPSLPGTTFNLVVWIEPYNNAAQQLWVNSPRETFTYEITDRGVLIAPTATPESNSTITQGSRVRLDNINNLPSGQQSQIVFTVNGGTITRVPSNSSVHYIPVHGNPGSTYTIRAWIEPVGTTALSWEPSTEMTFVYQITDRQVLAVPTASPDSNSAVGHGSQVRITNPNVLSAGQQTRLVYTINNGTQRTATSSTHYIAVQGEPGTAFTVRAWIEPIGDPATAAWIRSNYATFTYNITDRQVLAPPTATPDSNSSVAHGGRIRITNPNSLLAGQTTRLVYSVNGAATRNADSNSYYITVQGTPGATFTVQAWVEPVGAATSLAWAVSPRVTFTYFITDRTILTAPAVTPVNGSTTLRSGEQVRIDNPNNLSGGTQTRIWYSVNGAAARYANTPTHLVSLQGEPGTNVHIQTWVVPVGVESSLIWAESPRITSTFQIRERYLLSIPTITPSSPHGAMPDIAMDTIMHLANTNLNHSRETQVVFRLNAEADSAIRPFDASNPIIASGQIGASFTVFAQVRPLQQYQDLFTPSEWARFDFRLPRNIQPVRFEPVSGRLEPNAPIRMITDTEDADIFFRMENSPALRSSTLPDYDTIRNDTSWRRFVSDTPVEFDVNNRYFRAVALRDGVVSAVSYTSFDVQNTAPMPVLRNDIPLSGYVIRGITLNFEANDGTIFFTLDGVDPITAAGNQRRSGSSILLQTNGPVQLRAFTSRTGYTDSEVLEVDFVVVDAFTIDLPETTLLVGGEQISLGFPAGLPSGTTVSYVFSGAYERRGTVTGNQIRIPEILSASANNLTLRVTVSNAAGTIATQEFNFTLAPNIASARPSISSQSVVNVGDIITLLHDTSGVRMDVRVDRDGVVNEEGFIPYTGAIQLSNFQGSAPVYGRPSQRVDVRVRVYVSGFRRREDTFTYFVNGQVAQPLLDIVSINSDSSTSSNGLSIHRGENNQYQVHVPQGIRDFELPIIFGLNLPAGYAESPIIIQYVSGRAAPTDILGWITPTQNWRMNGYFRTFGEMFITLRAVAPPNMPNMLPSEPVTVRLYATHVDYYNREIPYIDRDLTPVRWNDNPFDSVHVYIPTFERNSRLENISVHTEEIQRGSDSFNIVADSRLQEGHELLYLYRVVAFSGTQEIHSLPPNCIHQICECDLYITISFPSIATPFIHIWHNEEQLPPVERDVNSDRIDIEVTSLSYFAITRLVGGVNLDDSNEEGFNNDGLPANGNQPGWLSRNWIRLLVVIFIAAGVVFTIITRSKP